MSGGHAILDSCHNCGANNVELFVVNQSRTSMSCGHASYFADEGLAETPRYHHIHVTVACDRCRARIWEQERTVMKLRDMFDGQQSARIFCAIRKTLVRTLVVTGDRVDMRTADGTEVGLDLDAKLTYQPWWYDRGRSGSVLVDGTDIKLCTELDPVHLEDGRVGHIEWRSSEGGAAVGLMFTLPVWVMR